jgi:MFS family permease
MNRNVRWLGLGGIVRAGGLSLIAPYFVLYLRNVLGLGYAEIGVLAAAVGIAPLIVIPFAGVLVDRAGRRRVLIVALVGEALSILGAAASMDLRSLPGVVVFASVAGITGSLGGPAISAYVADFASGSDRTVGFTWLRIGWNVGFSVGVLAGGSLVGLLGFAEVGFAAGSVLLGSTAILAVALEPSDYDRARSAGLPRSVGPSGAGFIATFRRVAHDRVFLALCTAVAIAQVSVQQWSPILPLYANTVLGVPYSLVGAALALNGVLVVVGQAPTTRLALGRRHTSILMLGIGLYVVGFLLLTLVAFLPGLVLAIFFGAVIVLTMGENVESIPTTTLPSNLAPAADIGAYNGAFFAITGVGNLVSPTVGGVVLALTSSPLVTWTVLMLPVIPAYVLLVFYVRPRIDRSADRA